MELVIITGMSGAGKSIVANVMEDIGYYCIDNMPPSLLCSVVELFSRSTSDPGKIAVVVDIRGGTMFSEIIPALGQLSKDGYKHKILFLDASDEKLITRYKETRRRHPMSTGTRMSVSDAVKKEREMLAHLKDMSDYVIDTTNTSTSSLKQRVTELFLGNISNGMMIQCMSFGFKYGCVPEADIVFDVRCLKNPFYVPELKSHTGLEDPVKDFVLDLPETKEFKDRLFSLIDYTVPLYCKEGKSQLVIAFGCTGGKHRSVVFAELIYRHLLEAGYRTVISHRDIGKE